MGEAVRMHVRVEGVVQGVGFRPFVHALASRLHLTGQVGNDTAGVFIDVEGPPPRVAEFLAALRRDAPPLAAVEDIRVRESRRWAPAGSRSSPARRAANGPP